ncbi:MAG TPA: signal peptidase II, partial [Pyrinomonadaceae bacterium]
MDTSINKAADLRIRFAWRAGYLLAAFGVYLADQASKAWAVRALRFGQARVVVPGFFHFIYTENPGIAFGQLQEGGSFG